MEPLIINGSMTSDSPKIREHIVQFDKRLYANKFSRRPKMDGLSILPIDGDERNWLDRVFKEKSVEGGKGFE